MAEAATARMRPEWQERPVVNTVAELATVCVRPERQEWHFVGPGGGRQWPKPLWPECTSRQSGGPHASRVARVASERIQGTADGGIRMESATVRMRPGWQEWH